MADSAASPLSGKTVFVSRSAEKNDALIKELAARGANAFGMPMIHFGPPEDFGPLDEALKRLIDFDWIIFMSQVAVDFTASRARTLGVSIAQSQVSVAVVGPTTADSAEKAGLSVNYVARKANGAAFIQELSHELKGKRILLPRSDLAAKSILAAFEKNGSEVAAVIAYRTLPPAPGEQEELSAMRWGVIDAALFFSPSAVQNFVDGVGIEKLKEHHQHVIFVAAGPTTAEALRKTLGFGEIIEAHEPSVSGVLTTLENFIRDRGKIPSVSVNPQ